MDSWISEAEIFLGSGELLLHTEYSYQKDVAEKSKLPNERSLVDLAYKVALHRQFDVLDRAAQLLVEIKSTRYLHLDQPELLRLEESRLKNILITPLTSPEYSFLSLNRFMSPNSSAIHSPKNFQLALNLESEPSENLPIWSWMPHQPLEIHALSAIAHLELKMRMQKHQLGVWSPTDLNEFKRVTERFFDAARTRDEKAGIEIQEIWDTFDQLGSAPPEPPSWDYP